MLRKRKLLEKRSSYRSTEIDLRFRAGKENINRNLDIAFASVFAKFELAVGDLFTR